MAERAGLENRILRKRDGGSNPSLSATGKTSSHSTTKGAKGEWGGGDFRSAGMQECGMGEAMKSEE